MKRLMLLAALAALFAGCSSNQTAQQCFIIETAACAAQHDPMTDRPGFGACLVTSAQACGMVPAPQPAPAK